MEFPELVFTLKISWIWGFYFLCGCWLWWPNLLLWMLTFSLIIFCDTDFRPQKWPKNWWMLTATLPLPYPHYKMYESIELYEKVYIVYKCVCMSIDWVSAVWLFVCRGVVPAHASVLHIVLCWEYAPTLTAQAVKVKKPIPVSKSFTDLVSTSGFF